MPCSRDEKLVLLATALDSIRHGLEHGAPARLNAGDYSTRLNAQRASFVTLNHGAVLRGCIGTIEPVKPLITGIEDNALNAAFRDPRFPRLKKEELPDVDLEISVLTVPKILEWKDGDDLKKKLRPNVHGVILSQGWNSSTFLPQVWEQLPDKQLFLEHLCQKGGMKKNCWTDKNTVVKIYEAEYFSEHEMSGEK